MLRCFYYPVIWQIISWIPILQWAHFATSFHSTREKSITNLYRAGSRRWFKTLSLEFYKSGWCSAGLRCKPQDVPHHKSFPCSVLKNGEARRLYDCTRSLRREMNRQIGMKWKSDERRSTELWRTFVPGTSLRLSLSISVQLLSSSLCFSSPSPSPPLSSCHHPSVVDRFLREAAE